MKVGNENIKLDLTPKQQKHLNSFIWYLNGSRACGRTYTMATAIALSCIRRPGEPFFILDHHPGRESRDFCSRMVISILDRLGYTYKYNVANQSITVTGKREGKK